MEENKLQISLKGSKKTLNFDLVTKKDFNEKELSILQFKSMKMEGIFIDEYVEREKKLFDELEKVFVLF